MYVRIYWHFSTSTVGLAGVCHIGSTLQWTSFSYGHCCLRAYIACTGHDVLTNEFSPGYQFSSMWNLSDDEDEQRLLPPGEHKLGLH